MSARRKKKSISVNEEIIKNQPKEYTIEELIELGEKKNKLKLMPTLYNNKKKVDQKEQES
ncbi:Uncharacterised protein [uncultured Coprococcus sp.]|uniref:hypothetical protein n=1 Tax=Coprococcus ammoniilyticus TaxID=2981785 RepID=UPI0008202DFF|nr:hypothetical protein [Coprococcus ammoniilyticus]MCU6731097.1 hypothetical protein [Coprococcus ammoniilyticus]SCH93919.1 Uncharacterised protein [uncultured Coprococcus sp.]